VRRGVPVSGSVSISGPRGAPVRVGVAAAAAAFGCTVVPVTAPEAPTVVPGKAEKVVHAGRVAVRSDLTLT